MKTVKKVVAVCMVVVLGVACLMLTACGNAGSGEGGNAGAEKETYVNEHELADVANMTYHSGYIVGAFAEAGGTYTVTLELDGENYTLTKHMVGADEDGVDLLFAYSGTYTQDGDEVTLEVPTKCEWSEDWAGLEDYGAFINGSGTTEDENAMTENDDQIFALFNTEYLNLSDTSSCEPETVTLEGDAILFAAQ